MGYQICFALFAVLATGLVVVALRTTRANAFRSGAVAGIVLALLALTGGSGLVVVPPVAAWLAAIAVSVWRGGAKGRAVLLLVLAALPLAYLGVYVSAYERPPHHPPLCTDSRRDRMSPAKSLARCIRFTAWVKRGMAGGLCRRSSRSAAATVAILVPRWKGRTGTSGSPSSGLLAVVAGVTGVAIAIGAGRAGGDWGQDMGLWSRYSLLSWPLLSAAYLVWVKNEGKWVPMHPCAWRRPSPSCRIPAPGSWCEGPRSSRSIR